MYKEKISVYLFFQIFQGICDSESEKDQLLLLYPYQPLLKITNTVNLMVFAKHYNEYWSIDERRTEHIIL